jgi:hypothetical protein
MSGAAKRAAWESFYAQVVAVPAASIPAPGLPATGPAGGASAGRHGRRAVAQSLLGLRAAGHGGSAGNGTAGCREQAGTRAVKQNEVMQAP